MFFVLEWRLAAQTPRLISQLRADERYIGLLRCWHDRHGLEPHQLRMASAWSFLRPASVLTATLGGATMDAEGEAQAGTTFGRSQATTSRIHRGRAPQTRV